MSKRRGDIPIDISRLTGECTCVEAWGKRPDVRVRLFEHHPDCETQKPKGSDKDGKTKSPSIRRENGEE
jgi:hypothetical protein